MSVAQVYFNSFDFNCPRGLAVGAPALMDRGVGSTGSDPPGGVFINTPLVRYATPLYFPGWLPCYAPSRVALPSWLKSYFRPAPIWQRSTHGGFVECLRAALKRAFSCVFRFESVIPLS